MPNAKLIGLCAGLAALVAAPLAALAGDAIATPGQKTIGQPSEPAKSDMIPSLAVINSRGATLQGNVLTMTGVGSNSIVFADRPFRAAGHVLTKHFLKEWDEGSDSFAKDPPNATISVLSGEGDAVEDAVVVLKSPKLDGDKLTFEVSVLEGNLSKATGPASLFIDWFAARGYGGRAVVGGYGGGGARLVWSSQLRRGGGGGGARHRRRGGGSGGRRRVLPPLRLSLLRGSPAARLRLLSLSALLLSVGAQTPATVRVQTDRNGVREGKGSPKLRVANQRTSGDPHAGLWPARTVSRNARAASRLLAAQTPNIEAARARRRGALARRHRRRPERRTGGASGGRCTRDAVPMGKNAGTPVSASQATAPAEMAAGSHRSG